MGNHGKRRHTRFFALRTTAGVYWTRRYAKGQAYLPLPYLLASVTPILFHMRGRCSPERGRSTTAAPHMRPQRRGWPRRDRGPPPERTQPACSRLAAVGGSRRRQHAALPCAQRAAAGSAPPSTANTHPSAFLMASAAAVMLAVPASMSASTLQAAVGVRDIRVRGRHPPRGLCAREEPVRTVAGGAKDSAPWRRIILPTCSRQPLQCEEAPFTATVN